MQENPYQNEERPLERADQMFKMGNLSDAILYYEAALQSNPNDSEVNYKDLKIGLIYILDMVFAWFVFSGK